MHAARSLTMFTMALAMLAGVALPIRAAAGEIDLTRAVVVVPDGLSGPDEKAVHVLIEEVQARSGITWDVMLRWPSGAVPVIAVGPARLLRDETSPMRTHIPPRPAAGDAREGYWLRTIDDDGGRGAPTVLVAGSDSRGVLFGVGRLLRSLRMKPGKVALPDRIELASSPRYPLRGHQLGYRPKTNSYDAWDLPQWERYIRDLALFGTNAIELIPPRSDDDASSPHFPRPPLEMMIGMSKICADYGLDVWIWYPAMDANYADPKTVSHALEEWSEVFRKLPRIDAVFVPGGDPGHTQPKYLMALLEKQAASLRRFHPDAQMWVSPQGFSAEWIDEFFALLKAKPPWLSGVVYGPQVRVSLPELRKAVPAKYPIRDYPDITHSLRCQYPVPDWDVAYALTEGREVINPRPRDESAIFHAFADQTIGFITYSEGCNDDVNKVVWSALGWDPAVDLLDVLRDYARCLVGLPDADADGFARGLFALEQNWRGPLLANGSVETTLEQFRTLERRASPRVLANWRFQQALYRAYFDGYERSRLIHETDLEERALDRLRQARATGSLIAMDQAEAILNRVRSEPVAVDLRAGLRAGRGALPEHPHATERPAVQGDRGGPWGQSRHDRPGPERSRMDGALVRGDPQAGVGAGAAEGARRDRGLDKPRARGLLRRPGRSDAPAAPGPRPAVRRGPGLAPWPDDGLRPGSGLASQLVPPRRHALRPAAPAALQRPRPRGHIQGPRCLHGRHVPGARCA